MFKDGVLLLCFEVINVPWKLKEQKPMILHIFNWLWDVRVMDSMEEKLSGEML